MGFQIQPRKLDVPETDPFANDKLDRKEPAEILTRLIHSFDGPCVIAIDAGWGKGKTTFLQMWAQHLRNQCFPVVEFNAWETDFADDSFLALTDELIEEIRSCGGSNGTTLDDFKSAAGKVRRQAGIELIQSAAASLDRVPVRGVGALGLTALAADVKADSRTVKNGWYGIVGMRVNRL